MNPIDFYHSIRESSGQRRESLIWSALSDPANVPAWAQGFQPVHLTAPDATGKLRSLMLKVSPDYLGVGDDTGFFRVPMWPGTAQRIALARGCHLPTREMVGVIYHAADVKIPPNPISQRYFKLEKFSMTSSRAYWEHNKLLDKHLPPDLGHLFAGHKKDIVLTPKCQPGHVAIYGWFDHGKVIQGLNYTSHSSMYVDYSHGVRLVHDTVAVDGVDMCLGTVLAHPVLHTLLSDEGVVDITKVQYGA